LAGKSARWAGSSRLGGFWEYTAQESADIAFFVKSPGANESMTCSKPFNTFLTHDLILAILRGEVTNQQDTVRWLEAHGTQLSPFTGGPVAWNN
jgi:hypothetical protein